MYIGWKGIEIMPDQTVEASRIHATKKIVNTKLHNTSEVDLTRKSTGFIKLLHF